MRKAMQVLLLALAGALPAAQAADACKAFKWDLATEVALFTQQPTPVVAGTSTANAAPVTTGGLYEAALSPQSGVKLAVPPSKPMLDDGAHAGLFRFRAEVAGAHRVAVDAGFWLEVIADGKALPALDFNGSPQCAGPRKVVVYELPAGADLVLQFTGAENAKARFAITRVAPPAP